MSKTCLSVRVIYRKRLEVKLVRQREHAESEKEPFTGVLLNICRPGDQSFSKCGKL